MAIKNTNFGGSDWSDGNILTHTDLNDTFNATDDWLDDNVGTVGVNGDLCFPIGSVIAWHKSLTGTPALTAGWLECNGQPVSDGDSPLDGTTLPDLNASSGTARFVAGATTSGSEAGAASHRHQYTGGDDGDTYGSTGPNEPVNGSYTTYNESRPPYMTMVWIIRVK